MKLAPTEVKIASETRSYRGEDREREHSSLLPVKEVGAQGLWVYHNSTCQSRINKSFFYLRFFWEYVIINK